MARFKPLILISILIYGSLTQLAAESKEVFSGNAIAVSDFLLCLNGNAYGEVLIQLKNKKPNEPEFIVIRMSVPCSRFENWYSSLSSHNQFRVFHSDATVTIIKEYNADNDAGLKRSGDLVEVRLPIWTILPGKESFQIPYGTSVLTYESAEWPVVPVI
jgi:hypothetical protein